jgi:FAD/FMN-containing dehydrogenase
MVERGVLHDWAIATGVPVALPESYVFAPDVADRNGLLATRTAELDFRTNPCVDFGRLDECIPAFVLRPRSVDELCECLRLLDRTATPFKLRGCAHSNGGQVLIVDGAVVELRGLDRIVLDRPEREEIVVEGGVTWFALVEHLQTQGRRPMVLTDNLQTTIGGTLAVGGVGDTSHIHGLQVEHVTSLVLVTPRGERLTLSPGDELFGYVLAGRGHLGVIAEATLRTCRRPAMLVSRRLRWPSLHEFVRDAAVVSALRLYELFRARVRWTPEGAVYVDGLGGHFAEAPPTEDRALEFLRPSGASDYSTDDLLAFYRRDRTARWTYASPAIELVYPLPSGVETFLAEQPALLATGVPQRIPIGASIVILPRVRAFPMAPSPETTFGMLVALRPQMSTTEARAARPALLDLARRAIATGARLYHVGLEPPGMALPARLGELKAAFDPSGLCNVASR